MILNHFIIGGIKYNNLLLWSTGDTDIGLSHDESLYLANHGSWDEITNEEACEVAQKRILGWCDKVYSKEGKGICLSCGRVLFKVAFAKGSEDKYKCHRGPKGS